MLEGFVLYMCDCKDNINDDDEFNVNANLSRLGKVI